MARVGRVGDQRTFGGDIGETFINHHQWCRQGFWSIPVAGRVVGVDDHLGFARGFGHLPVLGGKGGGMFVIGG